MTIRARESVATEFLRKALAGEALGVPKLDAMARAAGLIGKRQGIPPSKGRSRYSVRSEGVREKRRMGLGATAQF